MDDDIIADDGVVIQHHIRMDDTVLSYLHMRTHIHTRVQDGSFTNNGTIGHRMQAVFCRTKALRQFYKIAERIIAEQKSLPRRAVHFLVDDDEGGSTVQGRIVILVKIYESDITCFHLVDLIETGYRGIAATGIRHPQPLGNVG